MTPAVEDRFQMILGAPETFQTKSFINNFKKQIKKSGGIELVATVSDFKALKAKKFNDVFMIVNATALPELTDSDLFIELIKSQKLRIIFVREDLSAELIPQLLHKLTFKTFKNIFPIGENETILPMRIIRAWGKGIHNDVIARAGVNEQGELFVLSCGLVRYSLNLFAEYKAFRGKAPGCLRNFEVKSNRLYWPELDIDIGFENIKYLSDPNYRLKANVEKLRYNKFFGDAIKALRESYNLTQDSIEGVSDKTVREIEKGRAHPNLSTLKKLAAAHGLSFNEYFEKLGQVMNKNNKSFLCDEKR